MDKHAVQSKYSNKPPTVIFLLVGFAIPIGATVLDIIRYGLPLSLASVLAVQTTQPLHWIIDCVPVFTFLVVQALARANTAVMSSRSNGQSDGQGAGGTKTTQLVNELKNELAKQRRTEETLRASEAFYHNLVENTNDGIATISVDGTVTSVNRGFERMLGRLREEMVGKHYSTLLSLSSLGIVEDRIRRFQGGEKIPSLFEIEILHHNGSPIAVEARTRPILDANGTAIGFQGVYRDIAKRKAMKKGGAVTGTSATQAPATVMPWEQPSLQPANEAPTSRPDGYSPLSQRTDATSTSTRVEDEEHYDTRTNENSAGSLSTAHAQTASLSAPASSHAKSSSTPAFRFAETTSPHSTSTPPHEGHKEPFAASSLRLATPASNSATLDTTAKAKVVPFPTSSLSDTSPASPEETFNLDEALTRVDGDRSLLCEMAGVFLDEYPMLLITMQDALSHGNAQTLTYAVHTLKGSVGNFAATNAFEAALRLEKIARQGNLPQAKAALAELEAELARLVPFLTTLKMEIAA